MLQIFYVVVKNVLQTEALCYNEEAESISRQQIIS